MADEPDPLNERAVALRRMTPELVANVQLYSTAEGGRQQAARPGWGCPCIISHKQPMAGYDGWPVLDEPLSPGERRDGVAFVFLSPEGGEAVRKAGRFYLWEGKFIGEAVVAS